MCNICNVYLIYIYIYIYYTHIQACIVQAYTVQYQLHNEFNEFKLNKVQVFFINYE